MLPKLSSVALIILSTLVLITGTSTTAFAQEVDAGLSPAVWIVGIGLAILVIVGLTFSRIKTNKNKAEIQELMQEIKEENS